MNKNKKCCLQWTTETRQAYIKIVSVPLSIRANELFDDLLKTSKLLPQQWQGTRSWN